MNPGSKRQSSHVGCLRQSGTRVARGGRSLPPRPPNMVFPGCELASTRVPAYLIELFDPVRFLTPFDDSRQMPALSSLPGGVFKRCQ